MSKRLGARIGRCYCTSTLQHYKKIWTRFARRQVSAQRYKHVWLLGRAAPGSRWCLPQQACHHSCASHDGRKEGRKKERKEGNTSAPQNWGTIRQPWMCSGQPWGWTQWEESTRLPALTAHEATQVWKQPSYAKPLKPIWVSYLIASIWHLN